MKLIGLMLARNEDWIVQFSLEVALRWCDEVILFDHRSVDETGSIAASFGERVTVLSSMEPKFKEMDFRQEMLEEARRRGATHIAIIDADECLTATLIPEIRGIAEMMKEGEVMHFPMVCPWRHLNQIRVDGRWQNQIIWLLAKDDGKMMWTPRDGGYQLHARNPHGSKKVASPRTAFEGGVFHLQFASRLRLLTKHAWYKMMETVEYPGRKTPYQIDKMYDVTPDERGLLCVACPKKYWGGLPRELINLAGDPWHLAECQRMMEEHGRKKFEGLNLFGVV